MKKLATAAAWSWLASIVALIVAAIVLTTPGGYVFPFLVVAIAVTLWAIGQILR